ncbi:hypothetical protein EP7_001027 [Isosphaeraceae bacterium EP7]
MPSRLAQVAILVTWAAAAVALFTRDLLPEFLIGAAPDLRALASPGTPPGPVKWVILTAEGRSTLALRPVGEATTETKPTLDGGVELTSEAWFNSGELLRGTPLAIPHESRLEMKSVYRVDKSGSLQGFTASIRADDDRDALVSMVGQVKLRTLEVKSTGPLPILTWTKSFPYEPRGLVQATMGAMDRLPGLKLGQRWDTRVVSPLTGRVETVRVEVARRAELYWDGGMVSTLEVVAHMTPLRATTWVRPDGLVLRQEVPFPLFRVVLERLPDLKRGEAGAEGRP